MVAVAPEDGSRIPMADKDQRPALCVATYCKHSCYIRNEWAWLGKCCCLPQSPISCLAKISEDHLWTIPLDPTSYMIGGGEFLASTLGKHPLEEGDHYKDQ